ncbi:WAP four-disulfide core domain protein 5, partial [Camelus dromedarius]
PKYGGGPLTEKSGGCPPDDRPCLLSVPDQCVDDSQCPLRMKCCHQACFRQCIRKVSLKKGGCPEDRMRCLGPVQHLCSKDSDCQGLKRCCLGACGRDCRNPVRGMAPVCLGQVLSLSEPQLYRSLQYNKFNRSLPRSLGLPWPDLGKWMGWEGPWQDDGRSGDPCCLTE